MRTKPALIYTWGGLCALIVVAALMTGCTTNPVAEAESPELKAQALFGEYVIAEEAVARVIQNPQVPDKVKAALQAGHGDVNPIVEEIERQRQAIALLRVEKPEDVAAALLALNDLILAAQPIVNSFNQRAKP